MSIVSRRLRLITKLRCLHIRIGWDLCGDFISYFIYFICFRSHRDYDDLYYSCAATASPPGEKRDFSIRLCAYYVCAYIYNIYAANALHDPVVVSKYTYIYVHVRTHTHTYSSLVRHSFSHIFSYTYKHNDDLLYTACVRSKIEKQSYIGIGFFERLWCVCLVRRTRGAPTRHSIRIIP